MSALQISRTVLVTLNNRTYRVAPSQFSGYSVVEITPSGSTRPVRNLKERDRAIAAAAGGQP